MAKNAKHITIKKLTVTSIIANVVCGDDGKRVEKRVVVLFLQQFGLSGKRGINTIRRVFVVKLQSIAIGVGVTWCANYALIK